MYSISVIGISVKIGSRADLTDRRSRQQESVCKQATLE